MSTLADQAPAIEQVLHAVKALVPEIAARADEIESTRRVPPDLLDALRAAGCFRVQLPPSHGGAGAALPDALGVFEALSRADASVGWAVAIGAGAWCDLAGLPRSTFDEMYADPDRLIAGVFSPSGTATAVDGGYDVTGRWSFASGCPYADWIYGNTVETAAGDEPSVRTILFRPEEVEIEDTWRVLGMRGTASHHFRADAVVVPPERTFATFSAEPCVDAVIVRIPQPSLFSLGLATVAVGAARGALDDLLALALDKVPLFASSPLAGNQAFQQELARADTGLRAARSLLVECAEEVWAAAERGAEFGWEVVARTRAAAAWSTTTAVAAAESAYRFGGGSSLWDESPLQRRLRDLNVIAQHFLVRPDTLVTAGAVLVGQEIDVPVF
ncbi:MAG: acyl-CoA dehydrogenase family protein [Acidimicrobiales bacterium]